MKKQIYLVFVFILLVTGCKKATEETTEKTSQKKTTASTPTDCYAADLEGNKIEMQLQYNADDITGTLTYAFIEKDINVGTFKGKLANNILIADYTFQSEGVTSVRQIAFKLQDDQFVEGYGELYDNGTKFKYPTKLEFNSNMPLKKIDCP